MNYLSCQGCENYKTIGLYDKVITCCGANVNNPLKCPLRKRVIDPDWVEFFNATCERYRNAR